MFWVNFMFQIDFLLRKKKLNNFKIYFFLLWENYHWVSIQKELNFCQLIGNNFRFRKDLSNNLWLPTFLQGSPFVQSHYFQSIRRCKCWMRHNGVEPTRIKPSASTLCPQIFFYNSINSSQLMLSPKK